MRRSFNVRTESLYADDVVLLFRYKEDDENDEIDRIITEANSAKIGKLKYFEFEIIKNLIPIYFFVRIEINNLVYRR